MTDLIVPSNDTQGLVPADLIEKARGYIRASKSEGTLRTYASVWKTFTGWCASRGLEPLPASPETVVAYIVEQAEVLRAQTVKKHLAAVSQMHQIAGEESPVQATPVRLVMQGLRRTKGTGATPKKALRVEHVRKMIAVLPDTPVGIRDRAVILIGFAAGMRRSEIVGLDVTDVAFEPEGAVLTIRRSKRDQEGRGRRVPVLRGRHEDTCPVRALRKWMDTSGVEEGPLFVRLDPGARGERLSGKSVALLVKKAAEQAGLDPGLFSGHSLRRGFATETARAGASEREIARTTGHRSMAVVGGYIEEGTLFEQAAGRRLDI